MTEAALPSEGNSRVSTTVDDSTAEAVAADNNSSEGSLVAGPSNLRGMSYEATALGHTHEHDMLGEEASMPANCTARVLMPDLVAITPHRRKQWSKACD